MPFLSLLIAASTAASLDWSLSPGQLTGACTEAVRAYRTGVDRLTHGLGAPSFATIVLPLEAAQADLDDAAAPARLLAGTARDPALRTAARACRSEAEAATEATNASSALYANLSRAMRSARALDASDRALGAQWLTSLRNGGALLAAAPQRELLLREGELDAIEAAYDEHPDESLFARALATRDRLAHLLGYETWSTYTLAQSTLQSPMRAQKIIEGTLARTHAATDTPADRTIDPSFAAEHFAVDDTLNEIVRAYAQLFAVTIAPSDTPAWSPAVRTYGVNDAATGEFLGTIYLDLGAAGDRGPRGALLLLPARAQGAAFRAPVAAVRIALGPAPRRGAQHLDHAQVRELLGNLGAAVGMLFARTPYERLNRFSPDVAAAQSPLFARMGWDPSVLARLTANDPLPDALVTRLLATRQAVEDRTLADGATLAATDLALYSAGRSADVDAAWRALSDDDRDAIVREGGWLAVRRTLAQLYAADLFTAFAPEPLDPAVGLRYRQELLEPARSDDVLAEAARFLGRPLDLERIFSEVSS